MSTYYTERELIDRCKYYVVQLETLFERGEKFVQVGEELPVSIHQNNATTLELLEYNDNTAYHSGYSREELDELGVLYFLKHLHPYSIKVTARKVVESLRKNPGKVIGFVEYLHLYAKEGEYKPVLTFGKIGKTNPNTTLMISLIPQMFYDNKLPAKIEKVVQMDEFKFRHLKQFQQLTKREKEILTLLAEGLSNPAIGDQLFISRSTVETHRKHINRKLDIKHYRDVMQYALAFDLITYK